ncbi:MAG: tetratricopeptide repeat protein [Pyrinomonadaceae bacterium]
MRLFLNIIFVLSIASISLSAQRAALIKTEPNASVWLNGVLYGKTDASGALEIKNAPPGPQNVRVRADGFKEATKPLLAGSNQITLVKTTDETELAFQEAERLAVVDRAKAAEAYRKAIKLKPAYIDAHIGLARILSEAGDNEGADKAIKAALRLNPRNAEAAAVDGRIQKALGQETKAIAAFKRAIANGGGFQPEAYTALAMLYQERAEASAGEGDMAGETRNYDEAARNFSVAVKQLGTGADAPTVYQLLGLVYERQKKFREAITLYETFLRLFPDSVESEAVRSFIVQIKKQMAEQD